MKSSTFTTLGRTLLLAAVMVMIGTQTVRAQQAQPTAQTNAGKISITILAPEATGLGENQSHLPEVVRDEFRKAFTGYFELQNPESIEAALAELTSGAYADTLKVLQDIGNLKNTSLYMVGKMTKAGTDYHLTMNIVRIADKVTMASYSNAFNYWQLNNRTGIRQAALELLQQMGVTLTADARKKLIGEADESYINSRNAYAQGVTAQRQGSEVAALSYYLQAAAFDPSLRDAVDRSSILSANIKSGSIGESARNDIAWRKQWVARLAETERFFDKLTRTESMPCSFIYMLDIKQTAINYQRETVDLQTIAVYLRGNVMWTRSIERALQAVYDGLNATGRARDWGLANWPHQRVTNLNPFAKRNNFSVGYELRNDRNKVIHRGIMEAYASWQMNYSGRPQITVTTSPSINSNSYSVTSSKGINVNDVTDNMTVRITSVNGVDAETAAINGVLRIKAISKDEFMKSLKYRFENGVLRSYAEKPRLQRGYHLNSIDIPNNIWGDQVISIGRNAFSNLPTESITIGANISMFDDSFDNNFSSYYNNNDRKAGIYVFDFGLKRWTYLSEQNSSEALKNYAEKKVELKAEREKSYAEMKKKAEAENKKAEEKRENRKNTLGTIYVVATLILAIIGIVAGK